MANGARFNRSRFSGTTFNAAYQLVIDTVADLEGVGEQNVILNGAFILSGGAKITGECEGYASNTTLLTGTAEGYGDVIVSITRSRFTFGELEGKGLVDADPDQFEVFEFVNGLQVGDVLEIDTGTFEVKVNGVPVLDGYTGKFFDILPGETAIIYKDDSSQREVNLTIQYTNQFL